MADDTGAAGADHGGGAAAGARTGPNVLITGTPGTGKTTLAAQIAEATGLRHLCVGDMIKEKKYHAGKDEEFDSYVLDEPSEDALMDDMEPIMSAGGAVVDFHSCEFFPERWFDLVLVLRTDNTLLFDRLVKRGYAEVKVRENVECEIMQVVLEEARRSYNSEIVHEVPSNTIEDMDSNVERVEQWLKTWRADAAPASAAAGVAEGADAAMA